MKYVILKVDTTGLNPDTAEIVKIDALKVVDDMTERYITFVNPGCLIPQEASSVSGICNEDVADAPAFEDIKESLLDFIGNLPIIGHNINFDLSFINKYLDSPLVNKSMSLMDMARNFGYTGSLKFTNMCKHYSIPIDSKDIARTTDSLFQAMIQDYKNRQDN